MTTAQITPDEDSMHVFGLLRAREVRSLAGPVIEVTVAPGTRLISEDEQVGTFFVIRSGSATLSRDGQAAGVLGVGDCFGEADPGAPQLQPYTVRAASQLRLLAFSAMGIDRLCSAIPGAGQRILRSLPRTPPSSRAA